MLEMEKLNAQLKLSNELNYNILMSNIIIHSKIDENDKQILLQALQNRDRNYIRINDNEQVYENIKAYLKLLRPLALPLEKLERIGGKRDGGYVMFNVLNAGGVTPLGKALSLGVSEYSPWDLEMANLGFKVIEYDASIEASPYQHENISFHKLFIGAKNDESTITLNEALKQNHLDKTKNNILQCDIENCEWEMLENIDIALLGEYFTQVIFEFHGMNPEESEGFARRSAQLARLNEHFTPVHTHLNNHGKIFYSKGLFFSTTLEVSYLRKDLAKEYEKFGFRKEGNLKGLDYVTFLPNPELPLRFE